MNEIRKQKEQVVAEIKEKIEKCSSFVVIDYKGLTVDADTALRKEFRSNGIEYKETRSLEEVMPERLRRRYSAYKDNRRQHRKAQEDGNQVRYGG